MKKKKYLFYVLGAVVLFMVSVAVGQDRAGTPAYSDGEYWEYNVKKVSDIRQGTGSRRLEEGIYRVKIKDGAIKVYVPFKRGNASIHDPSTLHKWLDFPLHVGKKWNYRYQGRRELWHHPELVVVSLETVTTPAGTFSVFKITRDEKGRSYVYWYSPATKSVVKGDYKKYNNYDELMFHYTRELIKYNVRAPG